MSSTDAQPKTKQITVRFDGKTFVPDEPPDVPTGTVARVTVVTPRSTPREVEQQAVPTPPEAEPPLVRMARLAAELPQDPDWPSDGAAQHDHYLYGHAKRPENEVPPR